MIDIPMNIFAGQSSHRGPRSAAPAEPRGTTVPPPIGDDESVDRRLRRTLVATLPYALALVLAYGMVASALAVPLAHLERRTAHAAEAAAATTAPLDATAALDATARAAAAQVPRRTAGARADLHADHAPGVLRGAPTRNAGADPEPADPRDGAPADDHFDCCLTRVGTVGSASAAAVVAHRPGPGRRLGRAPRPRMPARPRPWRVSLGRHPPHRAIGTPLAA